MMSRIKQVFDACWKINDAKGIPQIYLCIAVEVYNGMDLVLLI